MSDLLIPNHVGFIVDGNRRWAKQRGLTSYEGHLAGYDALKEVMIACFDSGIKFVSAYVFSTENWKRSQDEVDKLMKLVLRLFTVDLSIFKEKNVRLLVLGSKDGLAKSVVKALEKAENATKNNNAGTLALCFNYGGQKEIVDAVKQIIDKKIPSNEVTVDMIGENLYQSGVPPIDMVVRTSGEMRLSNFMLWRSVYSELLFLDKMWPDMTKGDVSDIIEEYNKRSRRFGG